MSAVGFNKKDKLLVIQAVVLEEKKAIRGGRSYPSPLCPVSCLTELHNASGCS